MMAAGSPLLALAADRCRQLVRAAHHVLDGGGSQAVDTRQRQRHPAPEHGAAAAGRPRARPSPQPSARWQSSWGRGARGLTARAERRGGVPPRWPGQRGEESAARFERVWSLQGADIDWQPASRGGIQRRRASADALPVSGRCADRGTPRP